MRKVFVFTAVILSLLSFKNVTFVCAETRESQPISMRGDPSENPWEVSSSITLERGAFGTSTITHTVYIPVTLKRYFDLGDLSVTVPYTKSKGGSDVTTIAGRPVQTRSGSGSNTSTGSIGDTILAGSYYLLKEADEHPLDLSIIGNVKFPTADHDKGLGTGEFDETIGLSANKSFDDWLMFSSIDYTFIGDPSGLDLNNQFTYELGGGLHIDEFTTVNLSYQEKTAILDGKNNPREIILAFDHDIEKGKLTLFGNATKGLSDGSPDYGLTLGMSARF